MLTLRTAGKVGRHLHFQLKTVQQRFAACSFKLVQKSILLTLSEVVHYLRRSLGQNRVRV